MKKLSAQILMGVFRAYFDLLVKEKGHGALADFSREYKVPNHTIARIRGQDIQMPHADVYFNILNGIKDCPFLKLKNYLQPYISDGNIEAIMKNNEANDMLLFIDIVIKFTDILSHQSHLNASSITALFALVNGLYEQLQLIDLSSIDK